MIERYVRRELSDAERQVFEEHILDCADCFEQVQEMERFAAGMRHHFANSPADPRGARWFWPSLAAGLAAAVIVLGIVTGRDAVSLSASHRREQALTTEVAAARRSSPVQTAQPLAAGDLPLAILEATRGANSTTELSVPASAAQVALWIPAPGETARSFSLRISSAAGSDVASLDGLVKNRYDALAVAVPAHKLPPGTYAIALYREESHALIGQYQLRISIK